MKKITKIFITLIFTFLSLMILVIDLEPMTTSNLQNNGYIYQVLSSLKEFDIINSIMGIFIFYFYYITYYDNKKFTKQNVIVALISSILSLTVILGKLINYNETAKYSIVSPIHFIKCSIVFTGLYLIFYAVLKKVLIKADYNTTECIKKVKKKLNY